MDDAKRTPSEQDVKAWYNERYSDRGLDSMRPADAYFVFLDAVSPQRDKKLLDIACGTGFLLLAAAKCGLRTYGIDISEEAVKLSRQTSPQSGISIGKGEDLKFPADTFDYITCLGSLEHFLDMDKGLER